MEPYNVTDSGQLVGGHVVKIAGSGANVFAHLLDAECGDRGTRHEGQLPGWTPLTFLNNVSANRIFMRIAAPNGAKPNGVISSTYIKSQTVSRTCRQCSSPRRSSTTHRERRGSLDQQFDVGDNNLVYGLAVGWTFVDALKHSGKHPTRVKLMHAMRTLNEKKNPFVYPGMSSRRRGSGVPDGAADPPEVGRRRRR